MGEAESTGPVERQGNPTAYTYMERAHTHTHTHTHTQCTNTTQGALCSGVQWLWWWKACQGGWLGIRVHVCTITVNQDCWESVLHYMSRKNNRRSRVHTQYLKVSTSCHCPVRWSQSPRLTSTWYQSWIEETETASCGPVIHNKKHWWGFLVRSQPTQRREHFKIKTKAAGQWKSFTGK